MDEQCSEMTFNFWYTLQVLNIHCITMFFWLGEGGGYNFVLGERNTIKPRVDAVIGASCCTALLQVVF